VRFIADLHVHSHLSRATSRELDLEGLQRWARRKGITVVATGDFTHPRWFAELRDKLVPAEPGLCRLRDELARPIDAETAGTGAGPVRFILSVEVSSIYACGGRTRKVHNLIYVPDFEAAARVSSRLARIGNIASDGRPILGISSRDLLEITLESSPDAFLVPAHVWTPWFSALGAQSGFDSIDECFGDLADHVFALETGLSSDPAMNWRLSALDRYALVSSSDAHSPEKLGREATLFDCELTYFAMRDALRERSAGFVGTVEFFAEEGKYHYDGHRKCGVVVAPDEAESCGRLCRVCGKRLTGGVMSRVAELADRPAGFRPAGARPFFSLVPLCEVLGELFGVGPAARRVRQAYDRLIARVGSELAVRMDVAPEDAAREGPPLLDEALRRMRAGQVERQPGYDGEYGIVRMFAPDERARLLAQTRFTFAPATATSLAEASPPVAAPPQAPGAATSLAKAPPPVAAPPQAPGAATSLAEAPPPVAAPPQAPAPAPAVLPVGDDPEQVAAIAHATGPQLIVAGPGAGKTAPSSNT
jgi:DNA helicase-2/ATP-dependent DNA helicase PcrA